jgi:hypothetical protein
MRRAFRVRVVPLSMVGAMVGCIEQDPSVVINETDAPVRVRYSVPFFRVDIGAPPICPLLNEPPEVKPNRGDLRSPTGWIRPSSLEVDADKCEASYVLEPGVASVLNRDGYCDDYEQHADQGAAFFPNFEYVVIEGRGGAREWRGWEAVAQFKRAWWSGWCFMLIRE